MHLEAHLKVADFKHVFSELTPLRISLDGGSDKRFIALSRPHQVSLVAGRGLRVVADVQLQWDLIGLRVPVSMKRVSLLLQPNIVELAGQAVLAFAVQIEEADLSAIPSFVENMLLERVNEALAKREAAIAWRFMETLDFSFRLPAQISPRYRVRLFAARGAVRVDSEVLVLRVDWDVQAHPHELSDSAETEHPESEGGGL